MSQSFNLRRVDSGFSLLEVLVALAVLSVTLGMLLQSFATGTRAVLLSEQYSQAVTLAQARIAATGLTEPLGVGTQQGEVGIYRWQLEISPYPEADPDQGFLPYRVHVTVYWSEYGGEREFSLSTLRLAHVGEDA